MKSHKNMYDKEKGCKDYHPVTSEDKDKIAQCKYI